MAARKKTSKRWRYSSGERGRNRVRVFERANRGDILLQYAERDAAGQMRQRSKSLGRCTRETAKAKCDEAAARFATLPPSARPEPVTLQSLFDIYEREVSRQKGASKRQHDSRCAEMFTRFFGASVHPKALSRREWDRFIGARRRGLITPAGVNHKNKQVRSRVIAYDLRYLLAVLNWATVAGDGRGGMLLDRNPLRGMPLPREQSPRRPIVTAEQYARLSKAARAMGLVFEALLVVVHDTGHRIGSCRALRWCDVDLEKKLVVWRAEHDKLGLGHVTPLSDDVAATLGRLRSRQAALGDVPIFPQPGNPSRCASRDVADHVWEVMAAAAKLPTGERYGWHSLRRKFATELKGIPLKDLCAVGGWRSPHTILACYQMADEATQRAALAGRKSLRTGGLTG